jgi:hypothetical protein
MTRRFNVTNTCQHCGKQTTAETGFGRWMRNNPALDSKDGIVRTDTDHTILRYKTHEQGRDFQLIMDVEVKEFGSEPDPSQKDILIFKHQMALRTGKNMYHGKTFFTHRLKSSISGRLVRVRYLGFHLLQFEKTNPNDSTWIKWDRKGISIEILTRILLFDRHPYHPEKPMIEFLRDRHFQQELSLMKVGS